MIAKDIEYGLKADRAMELLNQCFENTHIKFKFSKNGDLPTISLLGESESKNFVVANGDGSLDIINSEHEYINKGFPLNPNLYTVGIKEKWDSKEITRIVKQVILDEIAVVDGVKSIKFSQIKFRSDLAIYVSEHTNITKDSFSFYCCVGRIVD